ncbi:MAG: hypothetical protein IID54_01460 [Proteobacteria bacterium]|nr:hypothetical protein [Pseudomonadota bacterium]
MELAIRLWIAANIGHRPQETRRPHDRPPSAGMKKSSEPLVSLGRAKLLAAIFGKMPVLAKWLFLDK